MDVIFRPLNIGTDWGWIREYLPLQRCEGSSGVVAYDGRSDKILAATVMEGWTATSVVTHIIVANSAALRHGFLQACFNYVFTHADRIKMYGHIRSDNDKCLKLTRRIGFKEVTRLTDAYEIGVDDVIMELHRDNCPYWVRPEIRSVANG